MSRLLTSSKDHFESKYILETYADMIRNHITPIMAYAELILSGKMGPVPVKQRKKIEVIRSEAKTMNYLLGTLKKLDSSKSSFIKNEVILLELKLALSKKELQEKKRQIKHMKKGKTKHRWMREEKKPFADDINSASSQITTVQNKVNKNTRLLAFTMVLSIITASGFLIFNMDHVKENADIISPIKSKYLIENLRGVTIDTWLSWRLIEGDIIYVNIVNGEEYPEKTKMIKDVILSKETLEIDRKLFDPELEGTRTYYLGWAGALEKASQFPTELYIPSNIEVITVTNGAGEIIIRLEDKSHGDGISGLTKTTADNYQNQILKSEITIYDIEDLSDNQLQTVMRHELGHAFGLSHSTDPDDLMHATIQTGFPYISTCDVSAIAKLYDGSKQSKVVCFTGQ